MLRREIDRNPDDPGLYERLAVFLDQNKLGAEQAEIYRRAMARFPDRSWYHKLARFYLREKKEAEFEKLTQEVVVTFSGTDREGYFSSVADGGSPQLYLRLNQYATRRFPPTTPFLCAICWQRITPRKLTITRAWESLMRHHWFEDSDLRTEFFEYLSQSGKLESDLSGLRHSLPAAGGERKVGRSSPLESRRGRIYRAGGHLEFSHFEEGAPILKALADEYPADVDGARAASSVYRSLAYFDRN